MEDNFGCSLRSFFGFSLQSAVPHARGDTSKLEVMVLDLISIHAPHARGDSKNAQTKLRFTSFIARILQEVTNDKIENQLIMQNTKYKRGFSGANLPGFYCSLGIRTKPELCLLNQNSVLLQHVPPCFCSYSRGNKTEGCPFHHR